MPGWYTQKSLRDLFFGALKTRVPSAAGALHPQEVGRMIQRVAHQINAKASGAERPWPDVRLAAHSTRIGAAHDLAAAGIDLTSIMHSGGWNDPKMPRYYTRELAAKDSGMARMGRARNMDDSHKSSS
jgi:hypothetical protein